MPTPKPQSKKSNDEILGIKRPAQRRCSAHVFEDHIRGIMDELEISSINFELPPLHKNLSKSAPFFEALSAILYEWKNTGDTSDESA